MKDRVARPEVNIEVARKAALELQRCPCSMCGACIEVLTEDLMPALGVTDEEAARNMDLPVPASRR